MKKMRSCKKTVFKIFLFILILSITAVIIYPYFARTYLFPKNYSQYVNAYSREYNVDENFIYAIIRTESHFDENAVTNAGAKGLMQITEDTYKWAKNKMRVDDGSTYENIFDPNVNIKYGTYILSILFSEFKDEKTVAAAYHAGRGIVKKWLTNDDSTQEESLEIDKYKFPITDSYVNKVIDAKNMYEKLYIQNN